MSLPAAAVFAAFLLQPAPAAEATDLRPIWREGQTSRYRIEQTETTTTRMNQSDGGAMVTEVTVELSWEVLEASSAGGGRGRMVIDDLRLTMTSPDGESRSVSRDRVDQGLEPMEPWVRAMSGAEIDLTVGPDGQIVSVRGHERVRRAAGELGDRLQADYFREIAARTIVLVGGAEGRNAGATWQQRHLGRHPLGDLTYPATYRLEGVETIAGVPIAMIERSSGIEIEPDLGELPAGAPPIEVSLSDGRYTGQIMFDLSRGEIAGAYFERSFEIELRIRHPEQELRRSTAETSRTRVLRIEER